LRGREHTPRLKAVNRVLAAHRTSVRGARAQPQAARRAGGGRGQPRAVWRLWAHTCVQHGLGRTVTCGVSAEVKLKAPFWPSSRAIVLTSGPFLAAGARAERYITPLRYTLCARGLFPFGQRGELLALGNLDISGAAALALPPAVRCKRPPSCRLFPTNSASVRRNPTCAANAARGGRLCVTTQRLERTGHGHTGAQDDSSRRRKALLQLPSAVLYRGCHALAQHCAQREERTGTDLATT